MDSSSDIKNGTMIFFLKEIYQSTKMNLISGLKSIKDNPVYSIFCFIWGLSTAIGSLIFAQRSLFYYATIFYTTMTSLFQIFLLNMFQKKQIDIYKEHHFTDCFMLKHIFLYSSWLNTLIDSKIITFLAPVITCFCFLMKFQIFPAFMYIAFSFMLYVEFGLLLLIINLAVQRFNWMDKVGQLFGIISTLYFLFKIPAKNAQYENSMIVKPEALIIFLILSILISIALYIGSYYLKFMTSPKDNIFNQ